MCYGVIKLPNNSYNKMIMRISHNPKLGVIGSDGLKYGIKIRVKP